jgi:hypothetical protein
MLTVRPMNHARVVERQLGEKPGPIGEVTSVPAAKN